MRAYTGQVAGLKRIGLSIDPVTKAQDKLRESTKDATKEQVDAAKKADLVASRQKALAALQDQFGGQARAYGRTQQGALDRVKVAWENLLETLGQKLAPTVTKVANRIATFVTQMTDGTGQGGRFVEQLKAIGTWLKHAGERLAGVGKFLHDHTGLIKAAAAAWVAYKVAVLAAAGATKGGAVLAMLRGGAGAAGPLVLPGPGSLVRPVRVRRGLVRLVRRHGSPRRCAGRVALPPGSRRSRSAPTSSPAPRRSTRP
jgi:hypothetical protein